MLKNRRERILAGVLAVVGVGCFAGEALSNAVLHPFGAQEKQLASLTRKVGDQSLIFQRVEHAQRRLKYDLKNSLPPDPSVAGTLYQNWLVEQARNHGLTDAVITPAPPQKEKEMGHRLTFNVQATSTPSQIGGFVDSLQRAPLLHRITQLDLSNAQPPASKGTAVSIPRLKALIAIEALALSAADPRQQLFSDVSDDVEDASNGSSGDERDDASDEIDEDEEAEGDAVESEAEPDEDAEELDEDEEILSQVRRRRLAASQSIQDRLAAQLGNGRSSKLVLRRSSVKSASATATSHNVSQASVEVAKKEPDVEFVSMQRLLTSNRLFERYEPPPPRPTQPRETIVTAPPKPDPLTQLQFVGTWLNGPQKEAWVFDAASRQNIVLKEGGTVRLLDRQALVAGVRDDRVTVVIANEKLDWQLGETFGGLLKKSARRD